MTQQLLPLEKRTAAFWAKVDPCRTDGCALWLGSHDSHGYGDFWSGDRLIRAHHFLVGKPPEGLEWDHVKERGCTHRDCVWPGHLELVTHQENTRRGKGSIPACPQGHRYDEENTLRYRGWRYCRACRRARDKARVRA